MSLICFLIIIHVAIGDIDIAYDAETCGISQVDSAARSLAKTRLRRSSTADAKFTNISIAGNSTRQGLDDGLDEGDDFMVEKILGGRRAERGELPWAARLLISIEITNGERKFLRKSSCGGTLVSRRHVITAAHCFQKSHSLNQKLDQCSTLDMYPLEDVLHTTRAFIGGTCSLAGKFGCTESDIGKVYRVARASYQKFFENGCKGNDIAILELAEDVPKTINHVCLPFLHKVKEIEDPYLKLSTFGWGYDPFKNAKFITPYLQVAELGAKIPENVCDRLKPVKAEDTFCSKSGQQHFCRLQVPFSTGNFNLDLQYGVHHPTLCNIILQGDSGGGVTANIDGRTYLMGIVSLGPNCDRIAEEKGSPSLVQVSTDINHHKKAIKKWVLTIRSRKPEVVEPLHSMPNRPFESGKPKVVEPPHSMPDRPFGSGKPKVVEPPHSMPDRPFESGKLKVIEAPHSMPDRKIERGKSKVVEPPHSMPDKPFESGKPKVIESQHSMPDRVSTENPKFVSQYGMTDGMFGSTEKPKFVPQYRMPYGLFRNPPKFAPQYRMPYGLYGSTERSKFVPQYGMPYGLFRRTEEPEFALQYRKPDDLYGRTERSKFVPRYGIPYDLFRISEKPKFVPQYGVPYGLFRRIKNPKFATQYGMPDVLFGRIERPKFVSQYEEPYPLYKPATGQNWNDNPFSSMFDLSTLFRSLSDALMGL